MAKQELFEIANGPVRATLVSEAPVASVLTTVTFPPALVVPMVTDPKERLLGDTETEPVVNALALVAVPPGVVTLSGPVVAPAGTVA